MMQATIERTREIFNQKMFECLTTEGDTLMCSINDAFAEFHENGHNCLGCNLQDDVNLIEKFLDGADVYDNINDFFRLYIILLYLLTEKVLEIKKIIGLPPTYHEKEFEVFRIIKLWANFYKHPKAFILTHHPEYIFDSDEQAENLKKDQQNKIVNIDFLKKYYRGEDINKYRSLIGELHNNSRVVVIVPSTDGLTQSFCDACSLFIKIVKENKAYKEILNDLSTLKDYFEGEYRVSVNE